jgi:uncharacterized SAM-binding protein YcdF (DUF218 family)
VKTFQRALFFVFLVFFAFALVLYGNYLTLPTQNTNAVNFDTLLVLGTSTLPDGSLSPEQRERTLEGVRQYKAGVARHIIFSGAAAHTRWVEAHVMAQFAETQGVPASAVIEESQALDTIQNIFYSATIMHQHGWSSAEVISSPYHLERSGLILNTFNVRQPSLSIDWRTHAAHWPPEYTLWHKILLYTREADRCLYLRFHGFPTSQFLPSQARN